MTTRRLALAAPLLMSACALVDLNKRVPLRAGQHAVQWPVPGLPEPVRMWLHLPRGYLESDRRWPLVVFLHGSGERGTDVERVKFNGPPKLAASGTDYPFILASPQLDEGWRWEALALHMLLGSLQAGLRVDHARISATGLSLGGNGVWDWATAYPRDLAAIAPICGFGEPDDMCRLAHLPVRAYHGDADTVVPLAAHQACVDALRACGGRVEFIVFPGVGHGAWIPAYDDPALMPWLTAQVRH